jgi:hypothetical protein
VLRTALVAVALLAGCATAKPQHQVATIAPARAEAVAGQVFGPPRDVVVRIQPAYATGAQNR